MALAPDGRTLAVWRGISGITATGVLALIVGGATRHGRRCIQSLPQSG